MKFLLVGLGSMGKRRIRNLQHLKAGEIFGFDPRADRREESAGRYGIQTCASFDDGMARDPDAVIISTPPDLHAQTLSAWNMLDARRASLTEYRRVSGC